MRNLTVLICDDNVAVHESISAYLNAENINVVSVYDGEKGLEQLQQRHFDMVILDIMLPKMFGTDVCREIRKTSDVPILMLSAKSEELDRIIGLELGADDYVTKPFSPREVVTRIKTILKRTTPKIEKKVRFAELSIDMEAYSAFVHDVKIEFTPKEIETLYCLASNQGKVLSREQILNKVWGYDYYGDARVVDTQIKRLRQKLAIDDVHFAIKAVYGVGYKFEIL
ncbi:response regulator transcription factor [Parasporobacterium paucivorans]|uniref:Stage 0 sporulation protein A homolog n=1 Tax=Parasporobacterium paucivorans DSM 15970 TaxID=1122934 RepID=A0A1M6K0N0_9FIRM|nr:response regulator transcription factor [Parasporobacterium paucivorans]SHJ52526.1 DNA-binding response regulator, OmpR family, contains REC and winged-helix (wHTH) domain [Parasporobacterium paucivorans DSM 15970]